MFKCIVSSFDKVCTDITMFLNRAKCEGRCAKKQWSGDHVCWLWKFASKFELRLHELQFFFWQNFTNSISAFALKHDFEGFCKVFHIASQILNSRALNVYPQHLFCVVLYQLILTNNQIRINVVFEAFELATTDKHTSALDGQVFPLFTEHIFYFKFPRISNTEFVCYLKWNFLIGFPMVTPKWYLFDCNLTVIFSKAQFSGKYLTFYAHNKKTSG